MSSFGSQLNGQTQIKLECFLNLKIINLYLGLIFLEFRNLSKFNMGFKPIKFVYVQDRSNIKRERRPYLERGKKKEPEKEF